MNTEVNHVVVECKNKLATIEKVEWPGIWADLNSFEIPDLLYEQLQFFFGKKRDFRFLYTHPLCQYIAAEIGLKECYRESYLRKGNTDKQFEDYWEKNGEKIINAKVH